MRLTEVIHPEARLPCKPITQLTYRDLSLLHKEELVVEFAIN